MNSTYDLVPADVGSTIRVRVTGTNIGGSSSAQSSQTSDVTARDPVNTALPQITGTPEDGQALAASDGTWTGTAPIDFSYQWLSCDANGVNCSDINGATTVHLRPRPGRRWLDDPRPGHRLQRRRQLVRAERADRHGRR